MVSLAFCIIQTTYPWGQQEFGKIESYYLALFLLKYDSHRGASPCHDMRCTTFCHGNKTRPDRQVAQAKLHRTNKSPN